MVDSVDMIINCGTQIALHPKQPLIQSERESETEMANFVFCGVCVALGL